MNWSEFFSMGGYAFYVWGSYLAALILIGGEIALVVKRRKAIKQRASLSAGKHQADNDSTDKSYETSS